MHIKAGNWTLKLEITCYPSQNHKIFHNHASFSFNHNLSWMNLKRQVKEMFSRNFTSNPKQTRVFFLQKLHQGLPSKLNLRLIGVDCLDFFWIEQEIKASNEVFSLPFFSLNFGQEVRKWSVICVQEERQVLKKAWSMVALIANTWQSFIFPLFFFSFLFLSQ